MVNSSDYDKKMKDFLDFNWYGGLRMNPSKSKKWKYTNVCLKSENILSINYTYFGHLVFKPPHIYGLPKIYKEHVLLRPIENSKFGPVYQNVYVE